MQESGMPEAGIQAGLPGIGLDTIRTPAGKGKPTQISLDDELELKDWKEKTRVA